MKKEVRQNILEIDTEKSYILPSNLICRENILYIASNEDDFNICP